MTSLYQQMKRSTTEKDCLPHQEIQHQRLIQSRGKISKYNNVTQDHALGVALVKIKFLMGTVRYG